MFNGYILERSILDDKLLSRKFIRFDVEMKNENPFKRNSFK